MSESSSNQEGSGNTDSGSVTNGDNQTDGIPDSQAAREIDDAAISTIAQGNIKKSDELPTEKLPDDKDKPKKTIKNVIANDSERIKEKAVQKAIEDKIKIDNETAKSTDEKENIDKVKGADIQHALKKKYLQVDNRKETRFHFKDRDNAVAFETKGDSITSKLDDKHVANDMLSLAVANGWEGIAIKGSKEFKSEVWLQASLKGMAVRGYRATKLDKEKLDQAKITEAKKEARFSKGNEKEKGAKTSPPQEKVVDALKGHMKARGDSDEAIKNAEKKLNKRLSARNTVVGRVVKMGKANYLHKPENLSSYFVEMETGDGNKTLWGVKLEELAKSGELNKGDNIALEKTKKEDVEVPKKVTNEKGVEETVYVSATKNSFKVHNLDKVNDKTKDTLLKEDKTRTHEPSLPVNNKSVEKTDQGRAPIPSQEQLPLPDQSKGMSR